MQVEIPREAIDAAVVLSTTGRQNHPGYRQRVEEIIAAAAPYLFAVWAERLTSDEVVRKIAREEAHRGTDIEWDRQPAWRRAELIEEIRDFLTRALAVAALSSVSGKDADG